MTSSPRGAHPELRARLSGPMPSLKTPFNRDGSIDFDGLRNLIDCNLAAGAKALMLTAGDSHYVALSEQEIAEVTLATIQHTAGRALVIAADRYYHTTQAIRFAEFARQAGADLLMVMPPDWGGSCTPATLAEHYRAVATVMPVMLVSNVFIARGPKFGLDTLRLVLDATDQVVAIKDDMCGEFARKMSLLVQDRWAVVSGGQKAEPPQQSSLRLRRLPLHPDHLQARDRARLLAGHHRQPPPGSPADHPRLRLSLL
jgi:dihydrodipicolinate synthase/N-acetylneuraminate lyase